MTTITVEKVYSKKIDYVKNGQPMSFIKYAVSSGGTWYTLKGRGKELAKEGDILVGEVEEKDYTTKDGKDGTEHILTLIDPMMADILKRVEALESAVFNGDAKKEVGAKNNSDLPF